MNIGQAGTGLMTKKLLTRYEEFGFFFDYIWKYESALSLTEVIKLKGNLVPISQTYWQIRLGNGAQVVAYSLIHCILPVYIPERIVGT